MRQGGALTELPNGVRVTIARQVTESGVARLVAPHDKTPSWVEDTARCGGFMVDVPQ